MSMDKGEMIHSHTVKSCPQRIQVPSRLEMMHQRVGVGKGKKPLPVWPGLSVAKGSPVGDEGAAGLLSIPAATNEEAVCTNHRNCHPDPHIKHHLRILMIPLAGQVDSQALLGILSLTTGNAIHRVNHRCKVIPHFQTIPLTHVFLLLLMLLQNFCKFLLPIGSDLSGRLGYKLTGFDEERKA